MYANPGTKWACPITIPCRNQHCYYQDSNTHCNHSKTIKTNEESYTKFIISKVTSTESKAGKYK